MRTVLLAALILLGGAAWAEEVAEPTDLERLEQLVNAVASKTPSANKSQKGGFLGSGGAKLDGTRRRPGQKPGATGKDTYADQTPEKDIIEMRHMARLVQEKAMRLGLKDINLTRCVNALSDAYGNKRKQIQASSGALSPAAAVDQLRQQLKRIKEADLRLGKSAPGGAAKADAQIQKTRQEPQPGREKPQAQERRELSGEELADMLWEKRKGIIKADSSADGLAPATVAAYLKTLTKAQRGLFDTLRGKYADRGFTPADADATALLELHGQLKEHPDNHNRKEVEAILKRL